MDHTNLDQILSTHRSHKAPDGEEELVQLAGKEIDRLLGEVDATLDRAMTVPDRPVQQPVPTLALRKYEPSQAPLTALSVPDLLEELRRSRPTLRAELEPQTTAPERQLLHQQPKRIPPTPRVAQPRHPQPQPSVPLLLRPLVWFNAPFEGLSDVAMRMLGRVAIVSFLGSIATLAYVMTNRGTGF